MKPDNDLLFFEGMVYICYKCQKADSLWYSEAYDKFICSKCFNNLGGMD